MASERVNWKRYLMIIFIGILYFCANTRSPFVDQSMASERLTNKDVYSYLKDHGVPKTVNLVEEYGRNLNLTPASDPGIRKSLSVLKKEFLYFVKRKSKPEVQQRREQFEAQDYKVPLKQKQSNKLERHLLLNALPGINQTHVSLDLADEVAAASKENLKLQSKLASTAVHIDELVAENRNLTITNGLLEERLTSKSEELKRVRSDAKYKEDKLTKCSNKTLQNANVGQPSSSLDQLSKQIVHLNNRIKELEEENSKIKDELKDIKKEEVVVYKEHFLPEFQYCVHILLKNHVSNAHVGPVINACLELVGKRINRSLCAETVRKMNAQRLELSQCQVIEALSSQTNLTVANDETSKYGTQSVAFNLFDSEGRPYLVGLREIPSKSAQHTLDAFKKILSDLDRNRLIGSISSKELVARIRNTMSDRAATEKKFNELLEDYKLVVLPLVIEGWDDLDDSAKDSMKRVHNFFCGLHTLVHIAEVSAAAILEVEKAHFDLVPIFDARFGKAKEAACVRLIRTACDAFAHGGHAKTSCHGKFSSFIREFLKENGYHSLPLTPFRHSRFNILFHNACLIYFLADKMRTFLEGDGSNKWVLHDLSKAFFMAGVRALGLINKYVTTQLWNVIERKDIPIMDMEQWINKFIAFIDNALDNLDDFIAGGLDPVLPVKKDKAWEKLIEPSDEYDVDCKLHLGVILPAVGKLLKDHYEEFINGQYSEPSEEMKMETVSVPKHNKACEANFSYLDALLRWKPNMNSLASEAYIMYSFNKTAEWVNEKDPAERKALLDKTYKGTYETARMFKERKREIQEIRAQAVREKMEKAEQRRRNIIQKKMKNTNEILIWGGLWDSEEKLNEKCENLSEQALKRGLMAQVRFRKNVLNQKPGNKKILAFQQNGRKFNLDELTTNVRALIRDSEQTNAV